MSRKPKEQVKYNPKYSDVKRADRVKYAITGKGLIAGNIFCMLFFLLMSAFNIIGGAVDTEEFLEGGGETLSVFLFSGVMFLFAFYSMNTCINSNTANAKQYRTALKGCPGISEVLMTLPVTKLTAYRVSFRYFTVCLLGVGVNLIVMNIYCLVIDGFECALGVVSAMSIICPVVLFVLYITMFGVISLNSKTIGRLNSVVLIIYYIVWIGSIAGVFNKFYALEFMHAPAGVPSLVFVVLVIAAIFVIEKAYVEKKAKEAAWFNE